MKALDNAFGKFLAGPIGSALRVGLALVLGYYVAHLAAGGTVVPSASDWQTWAGAALVVVVPVIIAAVNPQDPRFGKTTGS
jgi:hypothetical protein